MIEPDIYSYNFREDFEAATYVFKELRDFIPFTMLGKHAAYKVDITTSDFQSFNRGENFPSLEQFGKD